MALTKFKTQPVPRDNTERFFFENWGRITVTKKEEYGEYVARVWPTSVAWLIGFPLTDEVVGEARARILRILARKVRDIRQGGQDPDVQREDLSLILADLGDTERQPVTSETGETAQAGSGAVSVGDIAAAFPEAVSETVSDTLAGNNRFLGFLDKASGSVGGSMLKILLPIGLLLVAFNALPVVASWLKKDK